jgi:hypothetical protein
MTDSEFDELKKRTVLRQRRKTNMVEYQTAIKQLMDLDVSLPVILEWLIEEKKIATTLPALRRFVIRIFGGQVYGDFVTRNGWQKRKSQTKSQSVLADKASIPTSERQEKSNEAEVPVVSSSFESMLDGKQRDDFTKQYLPINPLFKKGK